MIFIDDKLCDICGLCAGVCEANAILIERDRVNVDPELCVMCRACISVCPVNAIKEDERVHLRRIQGTELET